MAVVMGDAKSDEPKPVEGEPKAVLVLSGKGGVGKTLVCVNLGYELVKRRRSIAFIDADLDNPNLLSLLGVDAEIGITAQRRFTPIQIPMHGINVQVFSMAGIAKDNPVSMEGSEYAEILRDAVGRTDWNAEYFLVDLPAGISDNFKQIVSVFDQQLLGSVIVMQPAHVQPARNVIKIHQMEGIPILGVVENMSSFQCTCGENHLIFGDSQLENVTKQLDVAALGSIPLSMNVRNGVAKGEPFLLDELGLPIQNAVERILEAKPIRLSFPERLKEKAKQIARNALFDVLAAIIKIVNTEIDVVGIQKEHQFPGGNVIELDITDETLKNVKVQTYLRIEDGRLKVVEHPKQIMAEVRVWDRALIWSFLGNRPDTNVRYDLMVAWLTGRAKYYSFGSFSGTPTALYFLRHIWSGLRNTTSMRTLLPVLKRLA